MSYVGSAPSPSQVQFSTLDAQSFNGDGSTTAFTLNRAVSIAASIEVTVNNVQQSPYDGSYTVNGTTTLTFSEAPSSGTDNIYVRFLDYPLASITPADGSVGSSQLQSNLALTGSLTVDGTTLTVDATNNYVGIGTASPDRILHIVGTEPSVVLENSSQSTDLKTWRIYSNSSSLQIGTVDDAFASGQNAMEFTRDNTDNITSIQFKTGASNVIGRWTTDGLCFNGDTAAANALDDYEEGSWTPTVGGNATYGTQQNGRYIKIGRLVWATFDMAISTIGTGSTTNVSGLPFTQEGTTPANPGGGVSYFSGLSSGVYFIAPQISGASIAFITTTSAQATVNNGVACMTSGTRILATVVYNTAS